MVQALCQRGLDRENHLLSQYEQALNKVLQIGHELEKAHEEAGLLAKRAD